MRSNLALALAVSSVSALSLGLTCNTSSSGPAYNIPAENQFTYDLSSLGKTGVHFERPRAIIFPDPQSPDSVIRVLAPETNVVLDSGEYFRITVRGCPSATVWRVSVEDTGAGGIELVEGQRAIGAGGVYTQVETFRAVGRCHGAIGMAEAIFRGTNTYSELLAESHGLFVTYSVMPVDSVWLRFDNGAVAWVIDSSSAGKISVKLVLKGTTNACKMKVETYTGDGVAAGTEPVPVKGGGFDKTVTVATVAQGAKAFTRDVRVGLYGGKGNPRVLTLKNPRAAAIGN